MSNAAGRGENLHKTHCARRPTKKPGHKDPAEFETFSNNCRRLGNQSDCTRVRLPVQYASTSRSTSGRAARSLAHGRDERDASTRRLTECAHEREALCCLLANVEDDRCKIRRPPNGAAAPANLPARSSQASDRTERRAQRARLGELASGAFGSRWSDEYVAIERIEGAAGGMEPETALAFVANDDAGGLVVCIDRISFGHGYPLRRRRRRPLAGRCVE